MSNAVHPKVIIGVPTYNRPELLKKCLDALICQTYKNIEIIISDNSSTDINVSRIGESYAALDSRVHYIRQPENFGASRNFYYLLTQSSADYFMWAGDDDYRSPEFVEELVNLHLRNPNASVAFCSFVAIDENNNKINTYANFLEKIRYFSSDNRFVRLVKYFLQPEEFGKANLIYGLMRSSCIPKFNDKFFSRYGGDMHFVYQLLSNGDVVVSDKLLYKSAVGNVKFYSNNKVNNYLLRELGVVWKLSQYVLHYLVISPRLIKPIIFLLIPFKLFYVLFSSVIKPFIVNKIFLIRNS